MERRLFGLYSKDFKKLANRLVFKNNKNHNCGQTYAELNGSWICCQTCEKRAHLSYSGKDEEKKYNIHTYVKIVYNNIKHLAIRN